MATGGELRILGAKFQTRSEALHALALVRAEYRAADAAVAPLADEAATATLLAGPFDEAHRDEVRLLLLDQGGEIVTDVDERLAG